LERENAKQRPSDAENLPFTFEFGSPLTHKRGKRRRLRGNVGRKVPPSTTCVVTSFKQEG